MNQKMIESFFRDYQTRFSPETTRSYRMAITQFQDFCSKEIEEVKPGDIRAWMALMEEKGLKVRSIKLKVSAIRSFFRYCMEENQLRKNPTLKVQSPKIDDSLPCYLSKTQLVGLQELTKNNLRDRAIIEMLYTTGVRISELLNIKLSDIKWEMMQIWIRKGKGNKERFVLFTYEGAERLRAYLDQREEKSEYVFANRHGKPLSRCLIEHQFRQYSEKLGFKVTPHIMRHTFAAHLTEKNMDFTYIQELLGHANVNSTRIYTRLADSARKKQYDRYL
ncbi:tyrosine-type recombinase/integrase [Alkalihalophilus marmarensis]|uniref:site-specific tyrosine recombinase/integron integrase n=1 Tax=Alkalihalophilus marmarensis TaxID=521377 RepID=UPI00203D8CAC|nr:site-specific tyrosine recombinase/integron integrase [Alkalihalophilus marmarensis]MCM3491778.1 tyrosine-type recombinase/integrase [Alkalihalophilus marmarensis]